MKFTIIECFPGYSSELRFDWILTQSTGTGDVFTTARSPMPFNSLEKCVESINHIRILFDDTTYAITEKITLVQATGERKEIDAACPVE